MDSRSQENRTERGPRYGPAAVATLTTALVTWPIAFNLGAYGEVFYDDVFRFVVASTVGLAIAMFASPDGRRARWFTIGALAAPALWLVLSVIFFDSTAAAASDPVFGFLALGTTLVAVPAGLKLLADLFVPDLSSLENNRVAGFTAAVIVVVAVTGFVVGANNDAFLTCDDFKIAGSDQPSNCASG
jgi:hypothetical protein